MRGASLARICALALALAGPPIGSGAHAELVSSAEPVPPAAPVRIGDALTLEGWSVSAAPGSRALVTCEAGEHGSAIRVDYDMGRAGSFVILRKTVDLALPENFAFSFRLRGEAPRATLEFKVVDGAENVWWRRYPDFAFAPAWQPMVVRRSRLLHACVAVSRTSCRASFSSPSVTARAVQPCSGTSSQHWLQHTLGSASCAQ